MIELAQVSASASLGRGRRATLSAVTFQAGSGVHAIIGTPADGTTLLADLLDGTARPRSGRVVAPPRAKVFRVALDAPLPEALRVDEVCRLAAELRGEPAGDRLGILGLGALAARNVRTLGWEERRAVTFALALSSAADVLVVEEPFAALDPVAPRLVADALAARGKRSCIVVTTASPRDALTVADRVAVLGSGRLSAIEPELTLAGATSGTATLRVFARSAPETTALVAALSTDEAVSSVASHATGSGNVMLVVSGLTLGATAHAVTSAIAASRATVDRIEPSTLPLDLVRVALAARMASPPPGSLPPRSLPPEAP